MLHAMRPVPKPVRALKSKKRKKASSRTLLEKRADALVREIVLDRDQFCVCPAPKKGHSDVYQCGHLVTRGKESVKWDLWNCNCQCSSDNMRHEFYPEVYTSWFIREFGVEQYHRLVEDSYEVRKLTMEELDVLIVNLDGIHRRQMDNPKWRPYFTQKQIMSGEWKNDGTIRPTLPNVSNDYVLQTQPIGR